MNERKKILWLVSWYPNKYDAFDGDFIQRHARAAAKLDDIHVLFVKQAAPQKGTETIRNDDGHLTEQVIYLPKRKGFMGKLRNYRQWKKIYKAEVNSILQRNHFDIVHVHVPWKVGLIALWIKRKYKIPFLVTEHWGIYNEVVNDNIHTKNFFVRYFLKKIFKQANTFISVSQYLGKGVNKTLIKKKYKVIHNVVETALFYPSNEKYQRFTFLHVSNMVPLKNVDGILGSFQQFLQQTNADAQLILVGNRDNQYVTSAQKMNLLNTTVFFKGEIPHPEVAKEMQQSHVFVLNSNIENSPCVIGEALCCGLPVIATNVGGIPELVNEQNSILIDPQNTKQLKAAMIQMFQQYDQSRSGEISAEANQKYSLNVVGFQFHTLYHDTGE